MLIVLEIIWKIATLEGTYLEDSLGWIVDGLLICLFVVLFAVKYQVSPGRYLSYFEFGVMCVMLI